MQSVLSYKIGLIIKISILTIYLLRIEANNRLLSIVGRRQAIVSANSSSHVVTFIPTVLPELRDSRELRSTSNNNRNKCKILFSKGWTPLQSILPLAVMSVFSPLPSFAIDRAGSIWDGSRVNLKSPTFSDAFSSLFFPLLPAKTVVIVYSIILCSLLEVSMSVSEFFKNLLSRKSMAATVINLQIGLDADWAEEHNIMQTLSEVSLRSAPADKLSEVSVALLRRQLDWNSAAFDCRVYRIFSKAELEFHQQCLSEWTKLHNNSGNRRDMSPKKLIKSELEIVPATGLTKTQVVVSLIAVVRGRSDIYRGLTGLRFIDRLVSYVVGGWHGSVSDVRDCLVRLAAEAIVDKGLNIKNAQIIYTPSDV